MDEYIAEQHADLVAAYRNAEAEAEHSVWPDRDDAANRLVVFDARPREASK